MSFSTIAATPIGTYRAEPHGGEATERRPDQRGHVHLEVVEDAADVVGVGSPTPVPPSSLDD